MPTENQGPGPEPTSAAYDAWASWLGRDRRGEAEPLSELFTRNSSIADELRILASDGRAYDLIAEEAEPGPLSVPAPARPGMIHADVWADDSAADLKKQLIAQRRGAPRYTYGKEIGRGGMGAVYEGEDLVLDRPVAIKRVHPALLRHWSHEGTASLAGFIARFLREARSLASLDHPGIVPIHDLDIDEHGDVFFVMPRISGETLAQILARPKDSADAWSLTRKLDSIRRIAEIVSFAHGKGILHRDLKPDNVMIDVGDALYVLDWGLAVSSSYEPDGSSPTEHPVKPMGSSQIGAPWYTAPEVLEGQAPTEQSDVYSLGAMLFEVVNGRRPYASIEDRAEAIAAVTGRRTAPGSTAFGRSAFPELEAIATRAMSPAPGNRHLSCQDFAAEIRAFEEGRVVGSYEQGALAELRKWVGRNRGVALASAAAALLAVGASIAAIAAKNADADRRLAVAGRQQEEVARESERVAGQQQLLAQSSAEAVRLALRQGEWPAALESIEAARAQGFNQPALLDLWSYDALSNLEKHQAAIGVLRGMDNAQLTVSERGRRDVRFALAGWQDNTIDTAEREDRVRSALETDLPAAEEGLARAFLATRVDDALGYLRSATDTDRFHSGARRQLMLLLQITGRNDELREELRDYQTLFPDDSICFFLRAHLASLDNDAEGYQENLKELEGRMPPDGFKALAFGLKLVDQARSVLTCDALHGHVSPTQAMQLTFLALKARNMSKETLGTGLTSGFTPTIPCAGRLYRRLPILITTAVKHLQGTGVSSEELLAMVDEELEYVSDGCLHYFRAAALLGDFPFTGSAEEADSYRRLLLDALDASTQHPSIMPGFVHGAKIESITMRANLDPHRSAEDWAEFQADVDWFLGQPALDDYESRRIVHICLVTNDIENARRALALRHRTHPINGWSHVQLARCDQAEGHYFSALGELKAAGKFEDSAKERDELRAEILAELERWKLQGGEVAPK